MRLHHIAILCSSEKSLQFYQRLGFAETRRYPRPERQDTIVFMEGHGITLELFLADNHPPRVTAPEAYGLRHLALWVEDVEQMVEELAEYHPEPIRLDSMTGEKMTFLQDPDGLPIELHE